MNRPVNWGSALLKKWGLLLFLLLQQSAFCQSGKLVSHPAFIHYTVEDGLASSEVYQVKQDSKGYIWFATSHGVSRYNGYEFQNFSVTDGLPDNTVLEIFEDNFGRIWFLPISCVLSYYYEGKIYQYEYNDLIRKVANFSTKSGFYIDKKGNVFISIFTEGLFRISPDGELTSYFTDQNAEDVFSIKEVDSLQLLNALRFKEVRDRATIFFDTRTIKGRANISTRIDMKAYTASLYTDAGEIILSNYTRLFIFKSLNEYQIEIFPDYITWVSQDRDKNIWVGTYKKGVWMMPGGDFRTRINYFPNRFVTSVLQDHENNYWFSTGDNAVYYLPSTKVTSYLNKPGYEPEQVHSIVTDGKQIYAASPTSLYVISPDKSVQIIRSGEPGDSSEMYKIFYDKSMHRLLVSRFSNPYAIDLHSDKTLDYIFAGFYSITDRIDDRYWSVGAVGLAMYDTTMKVNFKENAVLKQKFPQYVRANVLKPFGDSCFLIGAMQGLFLFSHKTLSQVADFGEKQPLLRQRILDLEILPDSNVVLATKGGGVIFYDIRQDTLYHISQRQGLSNDNVNGLCVRGDTVWCATNNGLSRIILSSKHPFTYRIQVYSVGDGLVSNEIKDVLYFNNELWLATNKGISYFEPKDLSSQQVKIPLHITQLLINDKARPIQPHYELPYYENNVKISYTGLNYKKTGHLRYRYMMTGLDTGWTYTQQREIQFTTLPPGTYTFMLSIQEKDGQWSETPLRIQFLIEAPFWKTWVFLFISALLLLYLTFRIVRYRFRRIQREREKREELDRTLMSLKQKALRAQMNPHFTFNVMNSIQHFILYKDEVSAHRYLAKFSRLMRAILNNSEQDTVSLSEEVKALELYLELEAMRFDQAFSYEINVSQEVNRSQVQIPSMLIQPYVENAIKHGILPSPRSGKIRITIGIEASHLKCVIEDNGIGRSRAAENKTQSEYRSMGTFITRERLTAINRLYGSSLSENIIDLQDENGNPTGTRVEIFISLTGVTEIN